MLTELFFVLLQQDMAYKQCFSTKPEDATDTIDNLFREACTPPPPSYTFYQLHLADVVDAGERLSGVPWQQRLRDAIVIPRKRLVDEIEDKFLRLVKKIFLVVVPVIPTGHDDPMLGVESGPHQYSQRPAIEATRKRKEPPSTSAKQRELVQTQRPSVRDAILGGRPRNLSGPFAGVYEPIFARFKRDCASTPRDISSIDIQHTAEFLLASQAFYLDEPERQRALGPILKKLLVTGNFMPSQLPGMDDFRSDFLDIVNCGLFKPGDEGYERMCAFLGELKNGIGDGGYDPLEQASHAYRKLCAFRALDPLRQRSAMPVFLISITGAQLLIAGGIFVDRVVVSHLTEIISLVPSSSLQKYDVETSCEASAVDAHTRRVAHVLRTFSHYVLKLREKYQDITNDTIPRLLDSPPWPHLTSVTHTDPLTNIRTKFSWTYSTRLGADVFHRCVFEANVSVNDADEVKCIVKFTSRYADNVHRLLEKSSAAPKLWYCEWVEDVGQMVVIYDYVDEKSGSYPKKAVDALAEAVKLLHANGLVHGDLRPPNVLLGADGSLKVIDCDWGGRVDLAKYPADINMDPDCGWHDGVHAGGFILPEHDMYSIMHLPFAASSSSARQLSY